MNPPPDVASRLAEADWLEVVVNHIEQAKQNIAEADHLMVISHLCLAEEALPLAIAQAVQEARVAGKTWTEIAIFAGEKNEDRNFQPVWKRMVQLGVPAKRRKGTPGDVSSQE